MDVETVGVCSIIFVVSAVVVYLISVFGTRETSFEEALEEKRRRAQEEAAAATSKAAQRHRDPSKKVKNKWGSRSKAKDVAHAEHVDFKEEAEVVLIPELEQEVELGPRLRQQTAPLKPILVHKTEHKTHPEPVEETTQTTSPKSGRRNSFRDTVPKDEIELKHLQEQQEMPAAEVAKPLPKVAPVTAVVAPVTAPAQPVVPKTSPQRSAATKKKATKPLSEVDVAGGDGKDLSAMEILALVRRSTRLNEAEEVQSLVDELLERAQGGGANSWTKRGKDPEAELKKQLAEREKELEAQRQHVQSHATKVKELRQELNQQLTRAAQLERTLKAHTEVIEKNNKAAERLREDARQMQQKVLRLEAELSQATTASLEAAKSHQAELESIRRQELEAAEGAEALTQAQARIATLETTCQELRSKLEEEEAALAASRVASENKVKELCKVHQAELEAEKEERKRQLATLEQRAEELNQLAQERSRLANDLQARIDDMASAHSRELKEVTRRHTEAEASAEETHKQVLAEKEAKFQELHKELEAQRAKNNDLRTKNWEVVEALQAAERKAQAQTQVQQQNALDIEALKKEHVLEVQSLQKRLASEQELKERALLERLLPKIKVESGAELGHTEWVARFEKELQNVLHHQEKKSVSAHGDTNGSFSPPSDDTKRLQEMTQANAKLHSEVCHYQKVLAETEEMLHSLQSSVEREEVGWREREQAHHKEAQKWKADLSKLEKEMQALLAKNASLETSLRELQGIQETTAEMQAKLKELQQKLQEEETEKKILEQKYDEASKNARSMQSHLEGRVRELEELKPCKDDSERLQNELHSVRNELEKERSKSHELLERLQGLQLNQSQNKGQGASSLPSSPKVSSTNGPSRDVAPQDSPSPTPSTEKEKEDKADTKDSIADDNPASKPPNKSKKRVRLLQFAASASPVFAAFASL
ncbi:ribosome-binding protein 1-like isoform X3 [Ornithodoros turicata]|uniref:ribosome-binding protein 1-like isoform X3 n=1 Tax=Ornithodoros turicata TaxID=34597 RepID=UPI00313A080D